MPTAQKANTSIFNITSSAYHPKNPNIQPIQIQTITPARKKSHFKNQKHQHQHIIQKTQTSSPSKFRQLCQHEKNHISKIKNIGIGISSKKSKHPAHLNSDNYASISKIEMSNKRCRTYGARLFEVLFSINRLCLQHKKQILQYSISHHQHIIQKIQTSSPSKFRQLRQQEKNHISKIKNISISISSKKPKHPAHPNSDNYASTKKITFQKSKTSASAYHPKNPNIQPIQIQTITPTGKFKIQISRITFQKSHQHIKKF